MGLGGTSARALTSQTRANVLIDNALWAPLFTHTHMHTRKHYTLYALTLHSKCTYAAVLHAASIQIAHHAFLYQNTCDALTHTLTYPHLHLHSPSFTLTSQRSQTQAQSHSQPLHNTRKPTARAISITLAPTFVSVSDRRDSERMANTEVRVRVKWITTRVN